MTKKDYLQGLKPDYNVKDLLSIEDPIFWTNYKKQGLWADIVEPYLEDKDLTVTGRHRPARGIVTKILKVFIEEMLLAMIMENKEIRFPGRSIYIKIVDVTKYISRVRYYTSTRGRAFTPALQFTTENAERKYGSVRYFVRFKGRFRKLYLKQLNSYRVYE
jgi:hypothetical protein